MIVQTDRLSPYRRRLALALGIVAILVTMLLPPPGNLEPRAWNMAGVAALMAAWWIGQAIPLAATALVPIVAYPLLGILPSASTAREYGNHIIYLFLGGFLLAIAMERWNLHRRLAMRSLLLFGTKPTHIVAGFGCTVAFLSMWVSNTATALMTLPVAMAVVRHLSAHASIDGVRDDRTAGRARETLGPIFMLTVAYSASAGGIATLVGTPPNIVLAGAVTELVEGAPSIAFAQWMVLGVPVSLALLALVLWLVPRIGVETRLDRIDCGEGAQELLREELRSLGPMSSGEKRVLAVFTATVALWLTRSPLEIGALRVPGWSELLPNPGSVHDATVAIAAGILLMTLRVRDDGHDETVAVLDWKTARQGVPWEVLILFGGGFALAKGFVETGLSEWLGAQLSVLESTPTPVIILGVCLLTTFLTEVTSNTATSTILMPVLAATAVAMDVPPLLLMIPAAISASCAFMLPVATPPNAVVFGSGWVTIDRMAKVGLVLNLSGAVVITGLCWMLARFVA